MEDKFNRNICYLRLSLTKVCNFRCQYCLPNGGHWGNQLNYLQWHEIKNLLIALTELGIQKVRLTGGEPTIRKDFLKIAQGVSSIPSIKSVALTTNGYSLKNNAIAFYQAGIRHINVSIDHLNAEQFRLMTGFAHLNKILEGLEHCLSIGYQSVKINAVFMRGFNDSHETITTFLEYIKNRPITVRFIELMKTMDGLEFYNTHHVSTNVVGKMLNEQGWSFSKTPNDAGPAVEYAHPDYQGKIGLIAPYSKIFCASCNRMRISANGEVFVCLFSEKGVSLRNLLQEAAQKDELKQKILEAVSHKLVSHQLHQEQMGLTQHFSSRGG